MTEIHGITGAPYNTPQVRKKLPSPHQRPRIDMDGGTRVKRTWKDTPVLDIKAGDMVADIGLIESVEQFIRIPGREDADRQDSIFQVRLVNVIGVFWDFPGYQRLFAFTPEAP
jgi:hypothetical protein